MAKKDGELTPMMKQFFDLKAKHPDAVMLFRCGDFYETYWEDPKLTKKLVKRGITELVTPGVALSDNVLNYKENNFLAAVHFGKASFGVAFLDISTGEFLTGEGTSDYVEKLLGNFSPKEILLSDSSARNILPSSSMTGCLRSRPQSRSCCDTSR